jgi:protein adenylyltransferase
MKTTPQTILELPFDNSYARLPGHFFVRLDPTPVAAPKLIKLNVALAQQLGLDTGELSSPEGVNMLAGNLVPRGAEPLAMAYAGHQFGSWVPQLGDGRAILLGEVIDRHGTRFDIQLKGSGITPFSRSGDGRAWLGPVLREYIVSEAMAALGVPTTRALAAISSGEIVRREELIMPGAVLTRVARSHIRIGTFQFFSARKDVDALRQLTDYVIARHYPAALDAPIPCLAMLDAIVGRQAALVARWQGIGFIHGVMNTDNMSVAGETIDYGPCAFMDTYHPATVFSSIDQMGRYAYQNQPGIAQWNLAQLAQTLLPLIDEDVQTAVNYAQAVIDSYPERFEQAYLAGMRAKLGLFEAHDGDITLVTNLLDCMAKHKADFTLTFRRLSALFATNIDGNIAQDNPVRDLFEDPKAFDMWAVAWRQRLAQEASEDNKRRTAMRNVNPAFIPRNHQVEAVIQAAVKDEDFGPFEELVFVLAKPYNDQPAYQKYTIPPQPDEIVQQTFCGT